MDVYEKLNSKLAKVIWLKWRKRYTNTRTRRETGCDKALIHDAEQMIFRLLMEIERQHNERN